MFSLYTHIYVSFYLSIVFFSPPLSLFLSLWTDCFLFLWHGWQGLHPEQQKLTRRSATSILLVACFVNKLQDTEESETRFALHSSSWSRFPHNMSLTTKSGPFSKPVLFCHSWILGNQNLVRRTSIGNMMLCKQPQLEQHSLIIKHQIWMWSQLSQEVDET